MRWFVVVVAVVVVICACDRGPERFTGTADDCSDTSQAADVLMFIERPPGNGLAVYWGTSAPGANQYTVIEMPVARESGDSLSFTGVFHLVLPDDSTLEAEHEADFVRESDSYTGTLETKTNRTEGTNRCDVVMDLVVD